LYALLFLLFAPIVALIVWGVMYDLKRRRRRTQLTDHDPEVELHRVRQDVERINQKAGGGLPPSSENIPGGF